VSNGARIGLLLGTVIVLVLAFVLLSPGDDDESDPATTPTAATTQPPAGDPSATATMPARAPAPAFTTIRVRGGQPVGGLRTITVEKGDRVRIRVSSANTADEIHLHGYDKYANVAPGRSARFSFEANLEGIFEIELHGTGTQIGKLVVEP
jgi:FtsP/CotA-like multicopper oxidase with cupredoxin domain